MCAQFFKQNFNRHIEGVTGGTAGFLILLLILSADLVENVLVIDAVAVVNEYLEILV